MGGRPSTKSALIKEFVATSHLGLRLVGQGDPVLSPDPAPEAQLSLPAVREFHLRFCGSFGTPAGGVGAPLFQLRGCTLKFSAPWPVPHSAAQDRGGRLPAFCNCLASGHLQTCAQWGRTVSRCAAPTGGPATWPSSVAERLTVLLWNHQVPGPKPRSLRSKLCSPSLLSPCQQGHSGNVTRVSAHPQLAYGLWVCRQLGSLWGGLCLIFRGVRLWTTGQKKTPWDAVMRLTRVSCVP